MFRNVIHTLATKGFVALVNFLILVVSAHYLGAGSRGEISIFILNLVVIQAISEIYTGYTLVYFVSRFSLRKLVASGLLYVLITCSICNVAVAAIHRQVEGFEWLGYLISLLVIINTFNCVLMLGREKLGLYNLMCLLQPLLLLAGIVCFIFLVKDVTFRAYIYPLLFSFVVAIIVSGTIAIQLIKSDAPGKPFMWKPILTNGFYYQAGILLYVFCSRFSYYMLPANAEVGVYASAVSLTESALLVMSGVIPALLALVAKNGPTLANARMALGLAKACLLCSAIVVAIISLLPNQVFVTLLGKSFDGIRQLMLWYAPAVLMASFFGVLSGYFAAVGNQRVVLAAYSMGFIVTFLTTPLFIVFNGTTGAANATCLAYLVITFALGISFFRLNQLPFSDLFSLREDYKKVKKLVQGVLRAPQA